MTPAPDGSALADPRLQKIVASAQSGNARIDARPTAALDALDGSPPRQESTPAIALAAATAYARVPKGSRDLRRSERFCARLVWGSIAASRDQLDDERDQTFASAAWIGVAADHGS